MKGKISRLIRDRGFGFIAVEGGKDVFFHSSALAEGDFDSLVEGAGVEFDSESGPKGPSAVNVRVEVPPEASITEESETSKEESEAGITEEPETNKEEHDADITEEPET